MLNISERRDGEFITLKHGAGVFKDALEKVKEGETHFHVTDDSGRVPDYDLDFTANMLLFPEHIRALILKMTNGGAVYAPFFTYNEDDRDNICVDFLKQFEKIELEAADEYSVGIARIAQKYTDIPVYYTDERFDWFVEADPQFHKTEALSAEHDNKTLRVTPSPFDMGYTKRDWSTLGSPAAFQNIFVWQAFTQGKTGPFKYVEVVMSPISGIGAILSIMSMISEICAQRGLIAYLQPGCTRYPEELVCRYFHVNPKPEDATDNNTIVIKDLAVFSTTWMCNQCLADFDESILQDDFAAQMSEYADAVLGGRKTLGVLARGTDYVTNNLSDDRIHAKPAHMIPVIKQWLDEGGYEKIFLATEDKDIYDAMLNEFPGKVIVIAQERHTVADLQKNNASLIYEFEQKINSGKAYEDALEDTTVNYFYALYILSKCDAFMCSGQCNGWDVVRAFNKGKFEKQYKFAVGIDKKGGTRAIGDPILSGKSFMYLDSSFRPVGLRIIFKDKVDPVILQKAVDQAFTVHEWASYGIYEEDGSFFYEKPQTGSIKVTESDWSDLPATGGQSTEGIMFGVYYRGNEVAVSTFHGLTDGKGFIMFADEVLKAYEGFLENGSYIPSLSEHEDTNAEPFKVAGELFEKMDLPMAEAGGLMDKTPFVILKGFEGDDNRPCHYFFKVDSADYMQLAKRLGVKPAALHAAVFTKAVLKVMGEPDIMMKVAIPVDFRAALEIPNTFRNCAMPPVLINVAPDMAKGGLTDLAASLQEELNMRTSTVAEIMAVKITADMFGQIPALPYKQTAKLFEGFSGGPVFTFNSSYVHRFKDESYLKLIDSVYAMYPSEGSQLVIEVTALPDSFCFTVNQGGQTREYVDAFCEVLKENGVACELKDTISGNAGYIELREYQKW